MFFGPAYLFTVGAPSLYSATFTLNKHDGRWYEMQANRKAERYFKKNFGVEWEKMEESDEYPLR